MKLKTKRLKSFFIILLGLCALWGHSGHGQSKNRGPSRSPAIDPVMIIPAMQENLNKIKGPHSTHFYNFRQDRIGATKEKLTFSNKRINQFKKHLLVGSVTEGQLMANTNKSSSVFTIVALLILGLFPIIVRSISFYSYKNDLDNNQDRRLNSQTNIIPIKERRGSSATDLSSDDDEVNRDSDKKAS